MKIKKTKIKDLLIIQPKIHYDKRGYFFESYHKKRYNKILKDNNFVQDNHSFSKKNVLKGIHFQHKNPQSQLLYLVVGKLYYCFVDLRPKSKTFLKNVTFILDSKNHTQIYQPPGVGLGCYVLSDFTHLTYKVSKLYDIKNEMSLAWNDDTLNLKWPCKKPILSDNDKYNFKLKDLDLHKFKDLMKL